MGRRKIARWFRVCVDVGVEIIYVVHADTIDEARKCFTCPIEDMKITPLTWGALSELTGCVIPSCDGVESLAEGDLLLSHKGNNYIMTASEGGD